MGKSHHNRAKQYQDLSKPFSATSSTIEIFISITGIVELNRKMNAFNLSTLALVFLAVVIAASQTDAFECNRDSSDWGEWSPCSESCGNGWRFRTCAEMLPSGKVNMPTSFCKEYQKCQVLSNNCETMEGDCVKEPIRCCKYENCKKESKIKHCEKPLCTELGNDPSKCMEDTGNGFVPDDDCITCEKPPIQKCADGYIMDSLLMYEPPNQCTKIICRNPDILCKENEFRCKNGQCIPNDMRCDKEDDCQDRSDEDSCVEG